MTTQVENPTSPEIATVAETVVKVRQPSKKSQAVSIFQAHLALRAAGAYTTNHAFRQAVLNEIKSTLAVSTASAATMYNSAKVDATVADPGLNLGRDPRQEKPAKVSTGRRGRPSKKTVVVDVPAEAVVAEPAPAGEAEVAEAVPAV